MPFYSIALGASIHMIDLIIWLKVLLLQKSLVTVPTMLNQHQLAFDDFHVTLFKFPDGTTAKVAAHGGGAHPHFLMYRYLVRKNPSVLTSSGLIG